MTEEQEEQIQTAIRLPKSLVKRFDKLAESMSKKTRTRVTRSDVHRMAALDGMAKLEKAEKR